VFEERCAGVVSIICSDGDSSFLLVLIKHVQSLDCAHGGEIQLLLLPPYMRAGGREVRVCVGLSLWRGACATNTSLHGKSPCRMNYCDAAWSVPLAFTNMAQRNPESPSFQAASKQDKAEFEDCTPCRIVGIFSRPIPSHPQRITLSSPIYAYLGTGSATFVGLGAFTYVSGHSQIRANEAAIRASKSVFGVRTRGAAITGTSAVMIGLGIYRWFS